MCTLLYLLSKILKQESEFYLYSISFVFLDGCVTYMIYGSLDNLKRIETVTFVSGSDDALSEGIINTIAVILSLGRE